MHWNSANGLLQQAVTTVIRHSVPLSNISLICLHTAGVAGSSPASPTNFSFPHDKGRMNHVFMDEGFAQWRKPNYPVVR